MKTLIKTIKGKYLQKHRIQYQDKERNCLPVQRLASLVGIIAASSGSDSIDVEHS